MTLQVVGAGLGRTGTLSLKTALEMLGFAPCHHMLEVRSHPEQVPFWLRAAKGEAVNWDDMFGAYKASVDWPSCHFYKQLAAHYPNAKVILSRRDPAKWYDSMCETIFPAIERAAKDPARPEGGSFVERIVVQQTFNNDLGRDNVIAAFERHNAQVIATIAPERLLVFEAANGWEPLCKFFGVDVPAEPYPRTNSRDEFKQHLNNKS